VLIHPDDVVDAERCLASMRYEPATTTTPLADDSHARSWHLAVREPAFPVDVHQTIWGAHASPSSVWTSLEKHSVQAKVGGATVLAPDLIGRLVLGVLHAAHHGRKSDQPLTDLRAMYALTDPDDHRAAWVLAGQLGAEEAFSAGLALIGEKTGAAVGTDVRTALRAASAPHVAVGIEMLRRTQGSSAKGRFLLHKLCPPTDFMRDWRPIARRGRIGLALAYLYRPLWLARWIVPGYLAWTRARRSAGRSSDSARMRANEKGR
jgi:hypothetical protein